MRGSIKKFLFYVLFFLLFKESYAKDNFHFAIFGDRTGGADQKIFEEVINEIKQLSPDFVMNVGDLIEGYTGDTFKINKEWDTVLNFLKVLDCPVYFVPGNHDIWDKKSYNIYQKRTGKNPYYSFDFGKFHFLIIDNSTIEAWSQIDTNQLKWIKDDLIKNKDKKCVVFFHKPFWLKMISNGEKDIMHNIFKEANVNYVISGHVHYFMRTNFDGIKYYIIGSSGAKVEGNEALGEFYGYAWVKIEDTTLSITYIKLGNIIPENALTFEEREKLLKIEKECISVDSIVVIDDKKLKNYNVNVKIKNILDEDFIETLKWNISATPWKVYPEQIRWTFKKRETERIAFKFKNIFPDNLFPAPFFEFKYPHKGWGEYKLKIPLKIFRKIEIEKTKYPPRIDGILNDKWWIKASKLRKFYRSGGENTNVEQTDVYLTYDNENLYIGIRCNEKEIDKIKASVKKRDDPNIIGDDCILIFIGPDIKIRKMYQVIINPEGMIFDQWIKFDDSNIDRHREWNGEWKISTGKEKEAWILELAIPFKIFGVFVKSGSEWGFNIGRIQQRVSDNSTWQQNLTIDPKDFGRIFYK